MFYNATNFNQPLHFDTSKVNNMGGMFSETNFNQPLNFDTTNVTDMYSMFSNTTNFNQPIYFKANNEECYEDIFKNSLLDEQENKYVLTHQHYNKLLLFYLLNQINSELLYLF